MNLSGFYSAATMAFETIGVAVIIIGTVVAAISAGLVLGRGRGASEAVTVLRNVLGGAILLGLEVFVAADLIRTITEAPTIENALSLLIIVLVRTLLSWTIQIEIDGVLPWKRAMFESGALVAARGLKQAASPASTDA